MMKDKDIFEKLVSLLGRSEHDPEVIAVLTELGEKHKKIIYLPTIS